MIGKPFGDLVVQRPVQRMRGGQLETRWRCICKCNKPVTVSTENLENGSMTSCFDCRDPQKRAARVEHDSEFQNFKYLGIKKKGGLEEGFDNQFQFSKKHGLSQASVSRCLLGRQKTHKGWTFRKIEEPDNGADTNDDKSEPS